MNLVELAVAIVAALNEPDVFSLEFEALRSYQPRYTLKELGDDIKVTVVPANRAITPLNRTDDESKPKVMIGVQRRCKPEDLATIDELVLLVDEIEKHLNRRRLADFDWQEAKIDVLYDNDTLMKDRVFLSVLTITYRKR